MFARSVFSGLLLWFPFTLIAALLCSHPTAAAPACIDGRDFSAMTFNTWGLPEPWLEDPARFTDIAQSLPSLQSDVVAFQEAFTSEAQVLTRMPDYPFVAHGPAATGPVQLSSGLLLVSKWPILRKEEWVFSACSSADCLANKGIMYVQLEVPGIGRMDVFNTHLNSADYGEIKSLQIDEVRDFVRYYSGPRPAIVLGDFNLTDDTTNYRKFVNETGLRDTYREFVAGHPELSLVDRLGLTIDRVRNEIAQRVDSYSSRIDYIWGSSEDRMDLCVRSAQLLFQAPVRGRHLSDHFAMQAHLRVSGIR